MQSTSSSSPPLTLRPPRRRMFQMCTRGAPVLRGEEGLNRDGWADGRFALASDPQLRGIGSEGWVVWLSEVCRQEVGPGHIGTPAAGWWLRAPPTPE
eukprot:2070832-Prymnesium_polylepis.1